MSSETYKELVPAEEATLETSQEPLVPFYACWLSAKRKNSENKNIET
jgi:hypothetical protein